MCIRDSVYVGYGITAPEYGYDDYEGIDVKGKIVIIERGIPYRDKDEKKRLDLYMRYASESYKLPEALRKGAAAVAAAPFRFFWMQPAARAF